MAWAQGNLSHGTYQFNHVFSRSNSTRTSYGDTDVKSETFCLRPFA